MLSIFNNRNSGKATKETRDQNFWWWEEVTPQKTQHAVAGLKDDLEIFRDYQRKSMKRA